MGSCCQRRGIFRARGIGIGRERGSGRTCEGVTRGRAWELNPMPGLFDWGRATMASGATSVTVNHGLEAAPVWVGDATVAAWVYCRYRWRVQAVHGHLCDGPVSERSPLLHLKFHYPHPRVFVPAIAALGVDGVP